MAGEKKCRVFVDTSVLIAAALSPRGGSFHVLTTHATQCRFFMNNYVLDEIRIVLQKKFAARPDTHTQVFRLIGATPIIVLPNPSPAQVAHLLGTVPKNDAPILASALSHADVLLTLDLDFLTPPARQRASIEGLSIMTPRELITLVRQTKPEE
jgi:predicted nucleic acid-binding protein